MRHRIWIPEGQFEQDVVIPVRVGLQGYFKIDLIDGKTGEIKQHEEFPNIITNSGLDALGSTSIANMFNYLEVGSGNFTVGAGDLRLQSALAPRTNFTEGTANVTTTNTSPPYGKRQITRVFTESQVNGVIRELGFWTQLTGGVLVNRALVVDARGIPTSITKSPTDRLRVQFEYRVYGQNYDVTGSDAFFSSYTLRAQGINLTSQWVDMLDDMGSWSPSFYAHESNTLQSSGSANDPSPRVVSDINTVQPYVNGTYYRDVQALWGFNSMNTTNGIQMFTFSPWGARTNGQQLFQMAFTPKILKINTQKFKITFRFYWGRV
jgi:hypothetical protein